MKRRLLIVCDPYGKPSFGPRIRYLSDYLNRKGWEIDVYTEQWDELCFEHAYPITEIAIYRGQRGSLLYKIDWTLKSIWSLLTDWKNRYFCRRVRKLTQGKTFDAILCTTFSTFPLPAAQALASERQLPLFCDLRDIDEQVGGTQYQQHRNWWTMPFRKSTCQGDTVVIRFAFRMALFRRLICTLLYHFLKGIVHQLRCC